MLLQKKHVCHLKKWVFFTYHFGTSSMPATMDASVLSVEGREGPAEGELLSFFVLEAESLFFFFAAGGGGGRGGFSIVGGRSNRGQIEVKSRSRMA